MRRWLLVVLVGCGSSSSPATSGSAGNATPTPPPPLVPAQLVDCRANGWCRLPGIEPGGVLRAMTSDSPGRFWGITSHGLVVRWDGAKLAHWWFEDLFTRDVWSDGVDTWISTYQGIVLRFHGGAWSRITVDPTQQLGAIAGVHGDGVWTRSDQGRLFHIDAAGGVTPLEPPAVNISSLWVAAPGDLWVVGSERGRTDEKVRWKVVRWSEGVWRDLALPSPLYAGGSPPTITGLDAKDVWVAAMVPYHWDGTSWTSHERISGSHVSMAAHDDVVVDGSQWNGTAWTQNDSNGLPAIALGGHRVAIGFEVREGEKTSRIPSGSGIDAKYLWAGAHALHELGASLETKQRMVVASWDGTRWTRRELGEDLPIAIAGAGDQPWVLGFSGDVWHLDGERWVREPSGVRGNALAVLAPGDVWVADTGMAAHRSPAGTWTQLPQPEVTAVRSLAAGNGQVFASWERAGVPELARWDGTKFVVMTVLPKSAERLVVRGAADVELAMGTQLLHWNGSALESTASDHHIESAAADGATSYFGAAAGNKRGVLVRRDGKLQFEELPLLYAAEVTAGAGHAWVLDVPSGDLWIRKAVP